MSQPVKIDLNKKSFPKQKTIQNFNIDAQGFRKTKNENPPTRDIGVKLKFFYVYNDNLAV